MTTEKHQTSDASPLTFFTSLNGPPVDFYNFSVLHLKSCEFTDTVSPRCLDSVGLRFPYTLNGVRGDEGERRENVPEVNFLDLEVHKWVLGPESPTDD